MKQEEDEEDDDAEEAATNLTAFVWDDSSVSSLR